jgi:choline-sulfatase
MNVLFILSDQHNPSFSGCYGHPLAHTPNIDSIARRGTRFESAYCVSPFCVPARAAMFTGRYAHEISIWDNTRAWNGTPSGWSHYFRDSGILLTTVGKLDFAPDADHGVGQERMAGHRASMDVCALYRDQIVPRKKIHMALREIRPRTPDEPPTKDMEVCDRALEWLSKDRPRDRPWVLNVNFLAPHPGWRPRQDIWTRYQGRIKDLPPKYWQKACDLHPANQAFSIHSCGEAFSRQDVLRCHEAYLAVIEELDELVGRLLAALEGEGILDDTLVIYASDHGELMRAHAAWTKCSMYEDSIRVPLVMAGPGVPAGMVDRACVSHMDVFPTIAEAVGLPAAWDKRGVSLLGGGRPAFAFSEFHGNGFPDGIFAIRAGDWKLVETANQRPQLYNLRTDPDEMNDLMAGPRTDPAISAKLGELRAMLSSICSPQAVDLRAKRDQAQLRAELAASGRLVEELAKRGFERRTDKLVNVPDPARNESWSCSPDLTGRTAGLSSRGCSG